jgi:hypothetical protein
LERGDEEKRGKKYMFELEGNWCEEGIFYLFYFSLLSLRIYSMITGESGGGDILQIVCGRRRRSKKITEREDKIRGEVFLEVYKALHTKYIMGLS